MADPIVETTDANGEATFTLDDYERDHDTYTATISKTHYVTQTLTFEATKDEEIDIVLESLPILTLTVTDGTNPVSGATVTIGTDEETSDTDGVVEFELEYGDYSATIEASGYTTATESLAFRSNHKNFTVTLTASPSGDTGTVTVTCLVNDGESDPYPLTPYGFVGLSTDVADWDDPEWQPDVASADTFDETGTATLATIQGQSTDIPFGTYYLSVRDEEYLNGYDGTLTVDGDEEVTITLIPIDGGDG